MTHYRTADDVAAAVGLSPRWLRRHARELPHTKVGRRYLFDDADVAALREALRVRPAAQSSAGSDMRPVTGTRRRAS